MSQFVNDYNVLIRVALWFVTGSVKFRSQFVNDYNVLILSHMPPDMNVVRLESQFVNDYNVLIPEGTQTSAWSSVSHNSSMTTMF